jgi:hypothetical protein
MTTFLGGLRRCVGVPVIALALASPASADPPSIEPGMESAALTVEALQSNGYDVVVQYIHGTPSGLSSCTVTDIDKGIAGSEPIAYVSVDCPD